MGTRSSLLKSFVCFCASVPLWLPAFSGLVDADVASPSGSKGFGAWTGTCNNIGACVAIGTTDATGFFYVRIARDAGVDAAPRVKLVLVAENTPKGASPAFAVKADAAALGPYAARTEADGSNQYEANLAEGRESADFVEASRNAETLTYAMLDATGTLDLKGLAATLRWIDSRQGRAGTPTALVAKGMTPIGQVPAPNPMPTVRAGPAGLAKAIDSPRFPKEVLAKAADIADCDRDTVRTNESGAAWRLGPDLTLWAISCVAGAYNVTDALYISDAEGGHVVQVDLPLPPNVDANSTPNVVTNTNFDPQTLILSEYSKNRGVGDCGDLRDWLWTGTRFELLDASQLDACPGALAQDWPNIYTAKRLDP